MAASAAASRPRRRGPTVKQAQRPITSYDAETGAVRHRRISDAEARSRAEALPLDTDPDTVDHPQVRSALVDRFTDIEREDEANSVKGRVIDFPGKARESVSSAGGRQVTSIAGHSVSVAQLPLGLLAYAALVNIVNGTFRRWVAAKFTNGGGELP
jgi:hypothetical protein